MRRFLSSISFFGFLVVLFAVSQALGQGVTNRYPKAGSGLALSGGTFTNTLTTGLAGGQTVNGGTAASENLILASTIHATKGKVQLGIVAGGFFYDENAVTVGIGTSATLPANYKLLVAGAGTPDAPVLTNQVAATNSADAVVIARRTTATTSEGAIWAKNGTVAIGSSSNTPLTLITNSVDRVTVDLNGTVNLINRLAQVKGASVASATSITLGTDGNFFSITGTTTTACIDTTGWQSGSVIYLMFAGALTITDSSGSCTGNNKPINIGAAYTTSANDTLTLILDGTTQWLELGRSVN